MGQSAIDKKTGKTVKCSKSMVPRKHFICPRNKSGYKTPGIKKCGGCGYAIWSYLKPIKP